MSSNTTNATGKTQVFVEISEKQESQMSSAGNDFQSTLLGQHTNKYMDNFLVTGYIREQTAKHQVSVIDDIISLFYKWYHVEFKWNLEDKQLDIELNQNCDKIRLSQQCGHYFRTIFLSPMIGPQGLHQFEFKWTGKLIGGETEFAIGIASNEYSTPSVDPKGVGDCDYSVSFYMNQYRTFIVHNGGSFKSSIRGSMCKKDCWFIFEVENKAKDMCIIRLFHTTYIGGFLKIECPVNCDKVGVSLVTSKDNPVELQLVNFNVTQ